MAIVRILLKYGITYGTFGNNLWNIYELPFKMLNYELLMQNLFFLFIKNEYFILILPFHHFNIIFAFKKGL